MMLVLANIPPSGFSDFIANAFYIIGLATAVVVLIKHLRKPKPLIQQPVRVTAEIRYATAEEHNKLRKEFEQHRVDSRKLHDELMAAGNLRMEAIQNTFRDSVGKTHRRIDALVGSNGELIGELRLMREFIVKERQHS